MDPHRILEIPYDARCPLCLGWGTTMTKAHHDAITVMMGLEECEECQGTGLKSVPSNEVEQ